MKKTKWGGARKGSGRKPAPPHLSGSTLIVNVRDLNQSQRETLIRILNQSQRETLMRIINEWLAQQKEETK